MRKVAFLLLLLFIGYSTPISQGIEPYISLTSAFDNCRFKLKETNISGWVKFKEPCALADDMKRIAYTIYDYMTKGESYDEKVCCSGDGMVTISGESENKDINVRLKTIHSESEQKYETIASIDITQQEDPGNITDIRREIVNYLNVFGYDPQANVCITEYFEGNLGLPERQALLDRAFSNLGSEKVEGICDDNLISMSGYIKSLPYYIKSGSRYININAACRYSTFDNRTYFLLGTPVITSEY